MVFKFLNKKRDISTQRKIVITYSVCMTIFLISYGIINLMNEKPLNFIINQIIISLIFDLIIISPLIINIIKEKRRLIKIRNFIFEKDYTASTAQSTIYSTGIFYANCIETNISVKCIYDVNNYTKNKNYKIYFYPEFFPESNSCELIGNPKKFKFMYVQDDNYQWNILDNIINRFELDDLKENRKQKLKKIKRWF